VASTPVTQTIQPKVPVSSPPAQRSLAQLLKDFEDKSPARKSAAVMSIALLDDSAVGPLLEQLRNGKTRAAQQAAAETLGILGSQLAVEPLCRILTSANDLFVFQAVAKALGRLGNARAVDILITSLDAGLALAPKNDPSDPFGFRDHDRQMTVFLHAQLMRKPLIEALWALSDIRSIPVPYFRYGGRRAGEFG
jgi:HEAT repeat protein